MAYLGNKNFFGAAIFLLLIGGGAAIFFSGLFSKREIVQKNDFSGGTVQEKNNLTTTAETDAETDILPSDMPVTRAPGENMILEEPGGAVSGTAAVENNGSGASTTAEETERFVVSLEADTIDKVAADLAASGFVKDELLARRALNAAAIEPGGYRISKSMSISRIAEVLSQKPYMRWVVIPEGLRKEEIALLLGENLGWTKEQEEKWIAVYTNMKFDNIEGVYFPDTYLIPMDEPPLDVANRLVAKFNEKFAPYLPEFSSQNIKWTTGLKLASIVQREAASDAEMPLIAGILWNRLDQVMPLGVDATLQYARGDAGNGWWAPITAADKLADSPYNTYKNKGLPPHPICNPGIPAIEAALKPAQTGCLYYLHGRDGAIHCAETYEEHQRNIEQYLKPVS
jgi:UPF0755 protein